MDASTLDALDNFINDASDQAAAWYSIVSDQPVVVPSAQIQNQQTLATQPGTRVADVQGGGMALLPASLAGISPLALGALVTAGAVVAWLMLKG
jgi:hypothetical protein